MVERRYHGSVFGPPVIEISNQNGGAGPQGYAMPALNNGAAKRFTATKARAIVGVRLRWVTVTTPGTVRIRIETIDATTGKPTGTLYDANATIDITPAASTTGTLYTFATAPTTLLTVGAEYAVMLITTVAGTAHTLAYSPFQLGSAHILPSAFLTAADASVRSNLAEVTNSPPLCSFVLDDGTEEDFGTFPWVIYKQVNIYGTNMAGLLLTVPNGISLDPAAIVHAFTKWGTPAGDLRLRILDVANGVLASLTVDKDSLASLSGKRGYSPLQSNVTLRPGKYRVVGDSAASTNGAGWTLYATTYMTAALKPGGFSLTTSTDGVTWTDSATEVPAMALALDDILPAASPRTRPMRASKI